MRNLAEILDWIQDARTDGIAVVTPELTRLRASILRDRPGPGNPLWTELQRVIEAREDQVGKSAVDTANLRLWAALLKALTWRLRSEIDAYREELGDAVRFAESITAAQTTEGQFNWILPDLQEALKRAGS